MRQTDRGKTQPESVGLLKAWATEEKAGEVGSGRGCLEGALTGAAQRRAAQYVPGE